MDSILSGMAIQTKSAQCKPVSNRYADPAVISTLNHELRNPLTVISSYSQLLERRAQKAGDDQAVRSAQVIFEKTLLLTEMIAAVTDTMKIEAGIFAFKDEQVLVQQEVQVLIEELRQQFSKPMVEVVCLEDEATGVSKLRSAAGGAQLPQTPLLIDPSRFRQALRAVILNALQFSPDTDKIIVSVLEQGDSVIIKVRDWGVGIPAKALQKVADAYYRGDSSHLLQKPGLGLGLFIASHIIKHYHGAIIINSTNASFSSRQVASNKQISKRISDTGITIQKGTEVTMIFPKQQIK